MTKKTPFDELILEHWKQIISAESAPLSDTFYIVSSWIKILRVIYLQMLDSLDKLNQKIEDMKKSPKGNRQLTEEETLSSSDDSITCFLNYFQFIDEINRTGRVLKEKGYIPPLYSRVYFFRNKIVEHWDDSLKLYMSSSKGLIGNPGKILIPHFMGDITKPADSKKARKSLRDEFSKVGIKRIILKDKWYSDYSLNIFQELEKIDPELKQESKKTGIPNTLVEALFKYNFPTPICNIEEYSKDLVAWLKTIKY